MRVVTPATTAVGTGQVDPGGQVFAIAQQYGAGAGQV
jgi:hypothetical protein